MKNKNVWSSIVILAFVLGFWLWSQRPGLSVEGVLPSHPLVFARLTHVEKHINQVIHSDLGKNIAAIDLPEVLNRNNFSPTDISDFQHWQKDLVKFWDNPLIKKFLGKEATVAIYRQGSSYQVFVALRLTLSTRIAELLSQLSHHWGDDVSVKRQKYHGRVINHILFKKQGLGLAYVRIRDLLIIAPLPLGHLEAVVDVYQHKQASLQGDPSFNFVRQNAYASGEGLAFVNLNLFPDLWRGEMNSRLTSLGYETAAFPVYGLSYMPGVVSKYKMMVGLDEKHMPSSMRKAFACPALSNDTLKLVPVNAIFYSWGICYDFEQSWAGAKLRLEGNPPLAKGIYKFKHRLEKHFKINIKRDVLPVLGHEIGGYLTDVDMQGTFPFPRLLVFVKIKDRLSADRLLDKFTQNPITMLHSEEYNHVNIHYVSLPLGANMDPGYSFLDDYLLVATSRQLLKRSIDAYTDSLRSITSDDAVGQFSLSNGEKFHSMTLMKTAELSRRAQDFLGWVDKYLSGQVSMAAAYKQDGDHKKKEIDEAIADKSVELVLAQKKLTQLKITPFSGVSLEDPTLVNGAIENLSREEVSIRHDIANYKEQKEDLSHRLDNYALGAQSAKLTMYNMENLVSPVLKGLESINAQAVTVRFGDKILETEFLVK
jgi:Protein of unknown function (DUF3352)